MSKMGFSIIVFGLIVMVAAIAFLSNTLSTGLCANKVQSELLSPSGQLKAIMYSRDCGADYTNNVFVGNASDSPPNKNGNVFVQDKSQAQLEWKDEHTLLIKFDKNIPVRSKSESTWVAKLPLPEQVTVLFVGN